MHLVTKIAGLLAGVVFSASAIALPLQNGDFSSGFDNWKGELYDGTASVELPADEPFGNHSGIYSTPGGGAATLTPDEVYWNVLLYQAFDVPTTVGMLTLSFSYEWVISDNVNDFVLAELNDLTGGSGTVSLFDSSSMPSGTINIDITALAGEEAELLFLIEDTDDSRNDSLTIRNITITETMSVPAPPTLLLLFAGLTGLMYRTKRG